MQKKKKKMKDTKTQYYKQLKEGEKSQYEIYQ